MFRKDVKILLIIVVCIALIELGLRVFEESLSGDIEHIRSIPELANELNAPDTTTILFLGNSLFNNGINLSVFKSTFSENEIPNYKFLKINPDGTALWDWYYLFKHSLIEQNNIPDILILGFKKGHFMDQVQVSPSNLANYFASITDLPEIISYNKFGIEQQSEFLLASVSYTFAHREAISKRMLDILIPFYRENAQRINDIGLKRALSRGGGNQNITFNLFKSFLTMLKENNIKAIFVAMPVKNKYKIETELPEIINSSGMHLLDLTEVPNLTDDMFLDIVHLDERGSNIFSQSLVDKILQIDPPILNKITE